MNTTAGGTMDMSLSKVNLACAYICGSKFIMIAALNIFLL